MLRYNRKNAINQGGVASGRFRPTAATTSVPKAPSHHSLNNNNNNNDDASNGNGINLNQRSFFPAADDNGDNRDQRSFYPAADDNGVNFDRRVAGDRIRHGARTGIPSPDSEDAREIKILSNPGRIRGKPDREFSEQRQRRRRLKDAGAQNQANRIHETASTNEKARSQPSPTSFEKSAVTRSNLSARKNEMNEEVAANPSTLSPSSLPSSPGLLPPPPPPPPAPPPSSPPLALDDESVANIECLGLRLVHLLSNISSVESLVNGVVGCRILECVLRSNLGSWISECVQRLVDGIDGGVRRWKELVATTKFAAKSGWLTTTTTTTTTPSAAGSEMGSAESGLEGEPPSSSSSKSRGSRHVFLIRHGQYFSKERSDRQKRLTRLGREQLVLTGRRLREVGFEYDAIVSSTMTRAKESAGIILDQLRNCQYEHGGDSSADSPLHLSVDKLLEEGAPLPPEPPLDFWRPAAAQFRADGPRIERAFRKYFAKPRRSQEKDTHDIIVCHANVIRYCVCRALQVPPQAWLRMWLNHGSITWLTIRPEGRIVLRALGASGYMPPEKLTAN